MRKAFERKIEGEIDIKKLGLTPYSTAFEGMNTFYGIIPLHGNYNLLSGL